MAKFLWNGWSGRRVCFGCVALGVGDDVGVRCMVHLFGLCGSVQCVFSVLAFMHCFVLFYVIYSHFFHEFLYDYNYNSYILYVM